MIFAEQPPLQISTSNLKCGAPGNVTASSIDEARGIIRFEIPTEPSGQTGEVPLRLFLLPSGQDFDLPSPFGWPPDCHACTLDTKQ